MPPRIRGTFQRLNRQLGRVVLHGSFFDQLLFWAVVFLPIDLWRLYDPQGPPNVFGILFIAAISVVHTFFWTAFYYFCIRCCRKD
jgi:hypothetical protein